MTASLTIFQHLGWTNPLELGVFFDQVIDGSQVQKRGDTQINYYRVENLLRHVEVENLACQDPLWMNTNTFYPEGKKTFIILCRGCLKNPCMLVCLTFIKSSSEYFVLGDI